MKTIATIVVSFLVCIQCDLSLGQRVQITNKKKSINTVSIDQGNLTIKVPVKWSIKADKLLALQEDWNKASKFELDIMQPSLKFGGFLQLQHISFADDGGIDFGIQVIINSYQSEKLASEFAENQYSKVMESLDEDSMISPKISHKKFNGVKFFRFQSVSGRKFFREQFYVKSNGTIYEIIGSESRINSQKAYDMQRRLISRIVVHKDKELEEK